jgi:hypothetical protein
VCSITHGAILRWGGRRGDSRARCPVARDELIVPAATIPAAINNTKQKARLNRDVLDVRSGFVIIGADSTAFYQGADTAVNIFTASIWIANVSSRAGDSESFRESQTFFARSIQNQVARKVRFGATPLQRMQSNGQAFQPERETHALRNHPRAAYRELSSRVTNH